MSRITTDQRADRRAPRRGATSGSVPLAVQAAVLPVIPGLAGETRALARDAAGPDPAFDRAVRPPQLRRYLDRGPNRH